MYPGFALMMTYGLRRGEVLGPAWEDLDMDERVIRVHWQLQRIDGELSRTPVKTDAGRRHLPMLPPGWEGMIELAERQMYSKRAAGENWTETGLVFTTRSGRPIEPRNLTRVFERICTNAGLRRIRLHDLRHTTASLLKRMGVPPSDAKEILGHARIAVTLEIFTHGDHEDHRSGLGRVAGELVGNSES
ncbi:site-specific integrase [Spirillospora sp. CA-108201]